MFELSASFIEPAQTAIPATEPEITLRVSVNVVPKRTAFTERVLVFRAGKIMGDLPRLSIQSIQGEESETYLQNAVAVLMQCADHTAR